jgi:hypothetical protein
MLKQSLLVMACMACVSALSAQTINATQTDEIIIDNGVSGKADPGDRIRYKVTIQNTAGPAGTGTQLNVVPDPNTTFVPGTFRSSPLAINDAYACTGNVGLNVPAASGLMANDFDDNIGGLTITAGTFATTGGGTIVIAADGSFTYSPPAGLTGGMTDSYTYTLNDGNGVGGGVPATDMATVTFTLNNLIWFVDGTAGGTGGTGTLSDPFKTLGDFNTGSTAAADVIYIERTAAAYNGGIVLQNNERLFGEGHTGGANLADVLPFALAPNSKTLPAINGSRPDIMNSTGDGVTLASNNVLRGFDVRNCSDFGMEDNGSNLNLITISEVNIVNTTGGGFKAGNGSNTMNIVFGTITSSGGVNGISLTNCMGTFTANGGTITNPTGTGVFVSGGTVALTYHGNITDNTGYAVDIDNHDQNDINFQTGNITSTAQGIRVQNCNAGVIVFNGPSKTLSTTTNTAVTLSNNTGSTVFFTNGGLAITTTSGKGFSATGGGIVNVTGTGNTISSTTGTALEVTGTTIGASGLTFRSISKNGGTNSGIVLSSTGSGFFSVTGTGSSGSGGTIENIVGADAISLNNTGGLVSLSYHIIEDITHANDATAANNTSSTVDGIHGKDMNGGLSLDNCIIRRISDSAINGSGATLLTPTVWNGLDINNSTLENCNRFNVTNRADQDGEGIVYIIGISGTVSVTNTTLQNGARGLHFYSASSGNIDMTVQNTDFLNLYKDIESINDSWGYNAFEMRMFGSCDATVRIGDPDESNAALGCQFTNSNTSSISILCHQNTYSGTIRTVISRNIFTVTDHLSPGVLGTNAGFDGEFPQGGVLLQCLGGAMEGVFSYNEFHDCMHANGGVGNLTLISGESSETEFIINNNTFDGPWDFITEVRSDNNTSSAIWWKDNIMPFKNLGPAEIDGTELEAMGLTSQPLPFESFFVDVRNNGFLDLTIQNETVPDHDRPNNSSSDNSFHIRTQMSGGTLNLEMDNNKATNGYQFQHSGGTFRLFKDLSSAATVQTVLQDNGNRGGTVNPNTNPPVVNVSGTITLSLIDPVLPSIGPF